MLKISCVERDRLYKLYESEWKVYSSLTDMSGTFGEPMIQTTWGVGNIRLEDTRYLETFYVDGEPYNKACEHYQWIVEDGEYV